MQQFAVLWQVLLMAPSDEHVQQVLHQFGQLRQNRIWDGKMMEETMVQWMMQGIEKTDLKQEGRGTLDMLCESKVLKKMQVPVTDFGMIFGQLCNMRKTKQGGW